MLTRKTSLISLLLLASLPVAAFGEPLKIAGTPIELVFSQVTGRTLRLDILPLDDQGKPKPTPPSIVLEKFDSKEIARIRDTKDLPANQALHVGNITVNIKDGPLTFTFYKPGQGSAPGKLLQELTVKDSDGSIAFHTDAPTFGLGEGRQQFDRRGFFYDFRNGQNTLLATHGATIPVPFLIGSDGWGMFVHNPPPAGTRNPNMAWVQFDLRGDDLPIPQPPARGGGGGGGGAAQPSITPPDPRPTRGRFIPRQDTLNQAPTSIFIMNLDTPADALGEYIHLFGKPVMPPKWVMGYMQSHRSIASSDEVLSVAKKLREDQIPCDALIYLGTGYTIANQANQPFGGWNMLNGRLDFNPLLFPPEMIDRLHTLDYKVILHKTNAPAGLHGGLDDQDVNPNDTTHVLNYWTKPARGRGGEWTDTVTHSSLMNLGLDAWWPDDGDELPIENRLFRIKAYYDGPLKDRPNERPWSLNRNGYAGVAKYGGWNWSGDINSRWATLAAHVPDGVQFSLCVSPWWGTDIGGFTSSNEYTGELYTRWYQFGAFNPLFRSHGRNWHLHTPFGWNTGEPGPNEGGRPPPEAELHNAAVEPACKAADDLRYQLLPYNYTITREACDTGMPLMRALLLAYPNDPVAVPIGDEYLWGPSILVAPVVEKGATERKVYLPAGDWYDLGTAEKLADATGRWVTKKVDLATIPLFIKAGSIIPMDPVRQFTAQKVTEPTTLHVFPGANGTFTLYDDDGHSQAYLTNSDPATEWIKFTWDDAAKKLSIDLDPRMKSWPANMTRTFKIQTGNTGPTKQLDFKGQHMDITL